MLKILTLLLTSTMTIMAGAAISPALPKIQEHFAEISDADFWVKLLLALPSLFTAIAGAPVGSLIDRYGRRPFMVGAVLLYGIAGSAGLLLENLTGLLLSRAFLGIAVAAITTISAALIADYYTGATRAKVLGWQSAAMGLGGVVFVLFGGFLAEFNWRMPFLIYLVAFIALPLVWLALPEPVHLKTRSRQGRPLPPDPLPRPNPLPTQSAAANWEEPQGSRPTVFNRSGLPRSVPNRATLTRLGLPRSITTEVAPADLQPSQESRTTTTPSASFSLTPEPTGLSSSVMATVYGLTILTMVMFYMVPVQLPFYLKQLALGSSREAGIAIAISSVATAIAAVGYGKLNAKLSFSKVLILLYGLMGAGYGIIATAHSYGGILAGLVLSGLGVGLVLPNINVWLNEKTPIARRGKVLGGLTSCIFLGQFCSPIALQPIVQNFGIQTAYTTASSILIVLAIGLATLTWNRWIELD
ncbi:MFS transporter [Alkalinema sp. FACHB-956]|uniref:MFS transporter n=1 Tax=Alkalinema sp. FACHB-956 TaxID=2692768 RepID=UPI001689F175|nr:MFS transporter [Alkalinema sp. FACHB-956]MBD2329638.1 MFS transporter [Alkalinema sp. FACHB-956]